MVKGYKVKYRLVHFEKMKFHAFIYGLQKEIALLVCMLMTILGCKVS